jgi:hypothetical protein
MDLSGLRVVVCALGGRRVFLELPESVVAGGRTPLTGGERSLYELATALSVLGLEVELRGHLHEGILSTLTEAAGAGPRVGFPPRRPEPGEIVILPEGLKEIDLFLACHLSAARTVVDLLGPPGLYGWSFLPGWSPGDSLTLEPASVGTPAMYRSMAELGFTLWSNAHGLVEAGRRAGVTVEWTGTGTPVPFPDPPVKTADVALIQESRWFPLAESVIQRLSGASVLSVLPEHHAEYSLSEALGPARILPWPSRVEGSSRIAREARAVGTVPVALDINPFATREDHGDGTVLVPDLDGMLRETNRLLEAPDELAERAVRVARSARADADWGRFVERVAVAVRSLPPVPSSDARAALVQGMMTEHARLLDTLQRESEARAAATRELATYRARRVIRLLDDSRLAGVIHSARRPFRRHSAR